MLKALKSLRKRKEKIEEMKDGISFEEIEGGKEEDGKYDNKKIYLFYYVNFFTLSSFLFWFSSKQHSFIPFVHKFLLMISTRISLSLSHFVNLILRRENRKSHLRASTSLSLFFRGVN